MSSVKDIDQFKERLYRLNVELIKIEKKIKERSDRMICDSHHEQTKPLLKFNDQLIELKHKKAKIVNKPAQKYALNDFMLKKA